MQPNPCGHAAGGMVCVAERAYYGGTLPQIPGRKGKQC
eukprot:SAG25_NODE_11007_length_316_cov_1.382488_2_plen_37_part_01